MILFRNFLDDAKEYEACEQYWAHLVDDILQSLAIQSHTQAGKWHRWIPRGYADGTPFELDGNPIYDGRSEQLDRAFRIIQHQTDSDETEISAWLKHYEEEYTDLPRDELVINLSLTRESARLAGDLLRLWMTPATTVDEMKLFIQENYTA